MNKSLWLGIMLAGLFSCEKEPLPQVEIRKSGTIGWNEKEACSIRYTPEGNWYEAGIKYRGGMSSRYEKHSYRVEFEQDIDWHNLPEDDDWVLNANYIDKTFMRHKLSYDLFRQMHLANQAVQCAYVNVELNENPQGLYVLMEKVNAGWLGIKDQPGAILFKDPKVFRKEDDFVEQPVELLWGQKYPEYEEQDCSDRMRSFRSFLLHTPQGTFEQEIHKWIDLRQVVDWQLLLLLSNNSDGVLKNFYLYRMNEAEPFRVVIWDCDHGWGRDGDGELNLLERKVDCRRSLLFNRLMDWPDYVQRLCLRWQALRDNGIFSLQNLRAHVARNHVQIQRAVKENEEVWPVDASWYYDQMTYEEEVDILLQYMELRIEELDALFGPADPLSKAGHLYTVN